MEPLRIDHKKFPVLVVDDEEHNLEVFRLQFRNKYDIHVASSAQEALDKVRPGLWEPAVVIADQRMPVCPGIDLLRQIAERCPGTVGIILTAYSDWDVLIQALHSGIVYRYLNKPWKKQEMEIIIRQAIERYALERENRRLVKQLSRMNEYLQDELKEERAVTTVIGVDGGLAPLYQMAMQVAVTPSTVLLRGESGTGKEVIARAIHANSPRANGPFIKVSCAALSPSLLESELFGHERGAFTGAVSARPGRFELAHRGTIFLDEVGDLPLDLQVKLLRVLQEQEFERVGGTRTIQVNARIISATHRDLEALIREGQFREDLYYRLNVFPLFLPPLRERPEDIPALVHYFVERFCRRSGRTPLNVRPETMEELIAYRWPGNVRELQNVIERAVILSRGDTLELVPSQLAPGWQGVPPSNAGSGPGLAPPDASSREDGLDEPCDLDAMLLEFERDKLVAALKRARGNKAVAARMLGLSRTTFYYRLQRHGLVSA